MNSTTVLILGTKDSGFSGSSHLVATLRDSEERFEPVVKLMNGMPVEQWKSEVSQVVRQSRPDVVLLTPRLDRMPAASCMLDCIRQAALSLPVLVLVENADAQDLACILNAGANDFVRLPLDAADLLPRLLRLKNLGRQEVFECGYGNQTQSLHRMRNSESSLLVPVSLATANESLNCDALLVFQAKRSSGCMCFGAQLSVSRRRL